MAKAPTKTQVLNGVAERSGLSKKEVAAVLDGLAAYIGETISDATPFTIPGLCKIVVQFKEAQPEREGINPFTKEPCVFKAKPASKTVRAFPMKKLKEMIN